MTGCSPMTLPNSFTTTSAAIGIWPPMTRPMIRLITSAVQPCCKGQWVNPLALGMPSIAEVRLPRTALARRSSKHVAVTCLPPQRSSASCVRTQPTRKQTFPKSYAAMRSAMNRYSASAEGWSCAWWLFCKRLKRVIVKNNAVIANP